MSKAVLLCVLLLGRSSSSSVTKRRDSLARPYFRQRQTPVTRVLISINVGTFLLTRSGSSAVFRALSKSDAMILRGQDYRARGVATTREER